MVTTQNTLLYGALEGFYGTPYTFAQRHDWLEFLAAHGLNTYVYAPKSDPLHRDRWREPYPPAQMAQFERLSAHAQHLGLRLMMGLSPMRFGYTHPADLERLKQSMDRFRAMGIESFMLLLDDMPERFHNPQDAERFSSLASAQAWLCTELLPHAPGGLLFTPTEYHGLGDSPYLRELGASLPLEVSVCWTGPEVCSKEISSAHLEQVSSVLQRPVTVWDNYPVNDLEMRFDPHIGPYEGREAAIVSEHGILLNLSLQPEISKFSVATFASFLSEGPNYLSARAWDAAARAQVQDSELETLSALKDLARRSFLTRPNQLENTFFPLLDAFWAARGGPPVLAGPELEERPVPIALTPDETPLRETVNRLAQHAQTLKQLSNTALRQDLQPWADKLEGWTRVLRAALRVLDYQEEARASEELLEALEETRRNPFWVGDEMFDQFACRCLWTLEGQNHQG